MTQGASRSRVALIYPPFGPPNLPPLGLAILSAGAKQRGYDCRTFFWHYRLADALPLPGYTMEQKLRVYELLTRRDFFPWSEWAFMRYTLPDQLAPRDAEVLSRLAKLDSDAADMIKSGHTGNLLLSQLILHLCNNAGTLLESMAGEVAAFDVIGIASTFFQSGPALALAKYIKDRWPEKRTVLGGANCDGEMGRAIIDNFPFVDYVFSGEVDHSFPEFLQRLDEGASLQQIPGILYRDESGEVVEGPPAQPVVDMNSLPIPDFDDYVAERKRFGLFKKDELCLPLESSRGCWWGAKSHCTFCGLNANGMAYRQKTYERFQEEVKSIAERYGTRYLFMADNILSMKYFHDFVQWAKENEIGVDFFYEIKANLSRRHVADLADAGITMVQPGIESFSTKILALMRKGLKGIQNVAFLKYASDYGMITAYNILAGFPGEDPDEYERMAKELPKLVHLRPPNGVADIEFHRFSPYHNHPEAFGIHLRPSEKYSLIYPFAESTVARLAYLFDLRGRVPHHLSYLQEITRVVVDWRTHFNSASECTLTWQAEGEDIVVHDRRPGFPRCDYRLQDHAVAAFRALDDPRPLNAAVRESQAFATTRDDGGKGSGLPAAGPALPRESAMLVGVSRMGASPAQPYFQPWPAPIVPLASTGEQTISFSRKEFAEAPHRCVGPLVESGLLLEEDGWFVTLPVQQEHRSSDPGWGRLGI